MDERAAAALGSLRGEATVTSSGEIAWAVRRLFERVAEARPLVVVFDDIHWGEGTFLELVEYVTDSAAVPDPVVLHGTARTAGAAIQWGGGKLNATTVLLDPLNSDEADELIARLLPSKQAGTPGLRERVRDAAAGNPLYLEEMAAAVAVSGGAVSIPPTIQALLAARLDQLELGERHVLERGSIEGELFHSGAVAALGSDGTDMAARLVSLVRKDIVRPDQATFAGDDAFRFRHLFDP